MPSLIPGYEYDIFISYRQNDNRSGWVTEFVKNLQEELAATIKLATSGRAAEAVKSIHRAIELDGRAVQNIAWLGLSNAILGKTSEALACLKELETHEQEGKSVSAWKLAVYAGLGDSDRVMLCLNEAFAERSVSLVFHLTHPIIDSLRGDPRFLDLLDRMGLKHLAAYRPNPAWTPVVVSAK